MPANRLNRFLQNKKQFGKKQAQWSCFLLYKIVQIIQRDGPAAPPMVAAAPIKRLSPHYSVAAAFWRSCEHEPMIVILYAAALWANAHNKFNGRPLIISWIAEKSTMCNGPNILHHLSYLFILIHTRPAPVICKVRRSLIRCLGTRKTFSNQQLCISQLYCLMGATIQDVGPEMSWQPTRPKDKLRKEFVEEMWCSFPQAAHLPPFSESQRSQPDILWNSLSVDP